MKLKMKALVSAMVVAGVTAAASYAVGQTQEPISPTKPPKQINLGMSELGKKLFFDPRLSRSGFISCNSCHNLSLGGSDNLQS